MTTTHPNKPSQPAPIFLTREQLAQRWRCSISSVKRLEAAGGLNPVRLGRRLVRYPMALIEGLEQSGAMAMPASRSATTNHYANTHQTTAR